MVTSATAPRVTALAASETPSDLSGAGDGIRTRDLLLGKETRYHCATPATVCRSQDETSDLAVFRVVQ